MIEGEGSADTQNEPQKQPPKEISSALFDIPELKSERIQGIIDREGHYEFT